ncbi:MAG: hypothetical protein ACJ8BC_14575 [Gemmatimonadales bacterium]
MAIIRNGIDEAAAKIACQPDGSPDVPPRRSWSHHRVQLEADDGVCGIPSAGRGIGVSRSTGGPAGGRILRAHVARLAVALPVSFSSSRDCGQRAPVREARLLATRLCG